MDANGFPSGEPGAQKASLFARKRKAAPPPPNPVDPREPKRKRPRSSGLSQISAVLTFILVGICVGVGGFVTLLVAERRAGPLSEDKVVVLTREDDDGPIADQLEKNGVVENAMVFSLMALLDGQRGALKRGEYKFPASINMREVEDMLAHHRVVKHKLPIPEGLTSDQIVERLKDSDLLLGDVNETPREGSLLPDTYVFERGDSRNALIAHMSAAMTKAVAAIWAKREPNLPVKSPGELVTLASIVEKETGKAEERPKVAAVFVNRLQKHMKLQSDPTIVYGLVFGKGTLGHSITRTELQEATPYNTYFIDGLPPGPICNPGVAAMEAVANPAHSRDLFFVADGSGGHAFAETLDQHQKNVAHWRQIEKDAKDAKDRVSPDAAPPANIRGETPALDGSRYGAMAPDNGFGDLAYAGAAAPGAAPAALAAKLARLADSRRKFDALVGAGGSLSAAKLGRRSLDSVVVLGVNDPPPGSDAPDVPVGDEPAVGPAPAPGGLKSAPMSAAAFADLRARAARYGDGHLVVDTNVADAAAPTVASVVAVPGAPRPRAFDASEGTKLDPLRNKTYDLDHPKDIPALFR